MQVTHNVNNSGTFIPILCSEISQSVYFLAVMTSNLWQRRSRVYKTVRCPSVCLSQHGPQQQILLLAADIDRLLHGAQQQMRAASLLILDFLKLVTSNLLLFVLIKLLYSITFLKE